MILEELNSIYCNKIVTAYCTIFLNFVSKSGINDRIQTLKCSTGATPSVNTFLVFFSALKYIQILWRRFRITTVDSETF